MQFDFIQFLKQLPFSRLIFPLIAGILFALNFPVNIHLSGLFFIFFFILFLFGIKFIYKSKNFRHRWLPGLLINILLVFGGALLLKAHKPDKFQTYGTVVTGEAVISEPISKKENSYKSILQNISYKLNDTVISEHSRIIVYFSKDEAVKKLKYGDKIIFKSRINTITNPGNPHEFDYKNYLFRKGITGQVFLKNENWKIISHHNANPIFDFAYRIRNHLETVYEKYGITGNELSVLQALTLGDRSEIDDEIRQAYVASGAMHILAVSGLHVGIIFMLFNFLLKFLDKIKYKEKHIGTWLKAALLIIIIWSFAILSGLSPSIRRAAVMFTFVIIGKALNRHINIYNSISASAFILLIINPYQITEVGFQLSYAAVLGIIFFQPKIVALLKIKNRILYYLWSLTAVSIAAQITTFPITLYYFHIFPTFFFLSNIIVIPAATLIIILAVFLLTSSSLPVLSEVFAFLLKYILKGMNISVSFIEQLPYSTVKNISFHTEDLIIAFLILIFVSIFILLKKVKSLQISLILLIIWIGFGSFRKITNEKHPKIFIYNINKFSAIDIIAKQNYFISERSIFQTKNITYGIHPNRQYLNTSDFQFIPIDTSEIKTDIIIKKGNFMIIGNKSFLIINEQIKFLNTKNKLTIDYIIITGDTNLKIKKILQYIDFKKIIIDSSNNFYQVKKIKEECKKLKIDYFSIKDKGFFRINL